MLNCRRGQELLLKVIIIFPTPQPCVDYRQIPRHIQQSTRDDAQHHRHIIHKLFKRKKTRANATQYALKNTTIPSS